MQSRKHIAGGQANIVVSIYGFSRFCWLEKEHVGTDDSIMQGIPDTLNQSLVRKSIFSFWGCRSTQGEGGLG